VKVLIIHPLYTSSVLGTAKFGADLTNIVGARCCSTMFQAPDTWDTIVNKSIEGPFLHCGDSPPSIFVLG
jgi:hypothetical protein